MLREKHDLRRKEKRLKELEKDFNVQLQKDYLSQVRHMRMSNKNNPMQEAAQTAEEGIEKSMNSIELPSLTERKAPQQVIWENIYSVLAHISI